MPDLALIPKPRDPVIIRCRFCHDHITLNRDSLEARELGQDPRQQMRSHLELHLNYCMALAYRFGWLTDMLAFEPFNQVEKWRENLAEMLGWCYHEAEQVAREVRGQEPTKEHAHSANTESR